MNYDRICKFEQNISNTGTGAGIPPVNISSIYFLLPVRYVSAFNLNNPRKYSRIQSLFESEYPNDDGRKLHELKKFVLRILLLTSNQR